MQKVIINLFDIKFMVIYDVCLKRGEIKIFETELKKNLESIFTADTIKNEYTEIVLNNLNNFTIKWEIFFDVNELN